MVKRIFVILLAFIYLMVATGILVEAHYCMGELADTEIGFLHNEADNCGKCGMNINDNDNDCCKDELKIVKLQDAHKLVNIAYQLKIPVIDLLLPAYPALLIEWYDAPQITAHHHSPPPETGKPDLNILFCVFRI